MGKRAPNGRSSIYLSDTDGRWHGWVTMGVKPNGELDRRHRVAKTETEVTRKVQVLEQQRESGTAPKPGQKPTMAQWAKTHLTDIAPLKAAPGTLRNYESLARCWVIPFIGAHRIDQLEPEHLDALYAVMLGRGLSIGYVYRVHSYIRHLLNVRMKRKRDLFRNVAELIDFPTLIEAEIDPYTLEESRAVLCEARRHRNGARWAVGLTVGTRQGETLGLRWQFINMETGETLIAWQLYRLPWKHGCADPNLCGQRLHKTGCKPGCTRHKNCPNPCAADCDRHAMSCPKRHSGGFTFRPPKGKRRRTIFLPPELLELLREHRAVQNRERLAAGSAWQDNDLVFCRPDGRPIDGGDDRAEWISIQEGAGIRRVRVHDGRHTAGTLAIEQGVNVRVLQELFGHRHLRDTQRYTHVRAPELRKAAGLVGTALFSA